jgi:DNA-binding MarR family transcriptional regulator
MQADIEELINEVRLLFNTMVQAGEYIHAGRGVTMAQRAVLEFLHRNGPATVPDIARLRRVSRQHIQTLVNPLLTIGAVESIDNPAHKRSRLIRLTRDGQRTIRQMRARETELLKEPMLTVSAGQLRQATEVLRSVRRSIESLR